VHIATEIAPAVARMNRDHQPLPLGRPDPPQNRFEADAMLIGGPHVDRRSPMRLRYRPYLGFQLFSQVARSSGLAALVWRGRGACGVKSSRCR
jgi:hypothetical protein